MSIRTGLSLSPCLGWFTFASFLRMIRITLLAPKGAFRELIPSIVVPSSASTLPFVVSMLCVGAASMSLNETSQLENIVRSSCWVATRATVAFARYRTVDVHILQVNPCRIPHVISYFPFLSSIFFSFVTKSTILARYQSRPLTSLARFPLSLLVQYSL